MANYVIKSAVAGETNPFENETPYFYSRILEYSPEPWIFQMYGNSKPSTVAPVFFEGGSLNCFLKFILQSVTLQYLFLCSHHHSYQYLRMHDSS